MMNSFRVQIPDAQIPSLHERAALLQRDLEDAASVTLIAGLTSLPKTGRFAVLDQPTLEALEQILGGGSVLNGGDLLTKVRNLAGISFHHIRLDLPPGQLAELQRKAEREGKTVEQVVDLMIPRIAEQFFGLIDNRG